MKDERIIDLVNGELDGTNSTSDHTELTTLLEKDPSVKEYLDEMQGLDQLLAAVPLVDPPATLKQRVMNAIAHQETPARSASTVGWFERVLTPFLQRPAWAVTYAFAIGIVVGIGVLSIIESSGPDTRVVQGTIVNHSPTLAETEMTAGTATADIVVKEMRDELRVDVHLNTSSLATISLVFDDESPIVIESAAGTPTYSLVLPKISTLSVILSSGEDTDRAVLAVDSLHGE